LPWAPAWRSKTSTSSASRSSSASEGTALSGSSAGRSFLDLHCHTSASFDSLSKPAAVLRAALDRGLTHLAITDHDRIDAALAAREHAPDGLTVIVGQEIRTTAGDLIGLFLEQSVAPGMSPYDAAAAVHERGGLVGLPHPYDRFRAGAGRPAWAAELERLLPLIDYVEAWNARLMLGDGNARAAEFAAAHKLPGVAVSDAHTVLEVGVAYTVVPGMVTTPDELRAGLQQATLVIGHGSRLVRLTGPVAKLVQRMRGNRRVELA
jgi:predicted metal-dependent phosphoesterase TrpH